MAFTGVVTEKAEFEASASLEAVFEDTHDRLLGTAIWLTGDRALAEEIVQDAFADLVEHWARLRDTDAAPAWLHRAVVNRSRSKIRRQVIGRRLGRRMRPAPEPLADASDAVVTQGPLAVAIGSLPQRQRECVVLRFYADLPVSDIAAALEIGEGSVKTHLHRGIARLRENLDPEDWQS